MSRALWFAAGTGAGLYVAVRARRAAEVLTVDGLQDRVGAAVVGLRMFRDEVAQGRADAETGLRERLGLALDERARHQELSAPPGTDPPTDELTDPPTDSPQEAGTS
ncbi:DUF6167 family protein [Nocardioides rubriscoriae]|uniref:DUF6167 family protein n=1 Tax=Nocardioides rubriscoriae TaxID=642762 RepID=UPI001B869597|nr:DUF6167 family protein [Nocardioides rubriscoriae]